MKKKTIRKALVMVFYIMVIGLFLYFFYWLKFISDGLGETIG